MTTDLLTSGEAAALLGVGATSVKRWADAGLLPCVKTAGKHRRFARGDVERCLLSGLPDASEPAAAAPACDARVAQWVNLLVSESDPNAVFGALAAERGEQGSWRRVAESLVPVLEEIGARWERGTLNILQEHMASERLARALARCGEMIPTRARAQRALLTVVEGDEHTLGLSLAELVLREAGWTTRWIGRHTPVKEVCRFLGDYPADMVAVSASVISADERALAEHAAALGEACRARTSRLVLGGRGAWPAAPAYGTRLSSLGELAEYAHRA